MYSNEQLIAIHNSKIGFEFEFYAKDNLTNVKESLTRSLNKKIRIEEKSHSDYTPTEDVFKLEPDFSGGSGMIELVTGPLHFNEAKLILAKTLKWIRENGSTNDRCSIHVNLAFNVHTLGPVVNMTKLDVGKFVLSFDEELVYKNFPKRRDSVYVKSIKFVIPLSRMSLDFPDKTLSLNYRFANEKYYGINFTKIPKGYIEFRYLGGAGYEKMYNSILKMTEHFILSLYKTLMNPQYTKKDELELDKILKNHQSVIQSYKSYKKFKEYYPKIKLMIDLKTADNIIEMYYVKLKDTLFELITESNLTEGLINYDSDTGRIQLKDANLKKCFSVTGIDLVDCTIDGNIKSCDLFNCDVNNSSIIQSNLFNYTKVKGSKIKDSYINTNSNLKDCYVFGKMTVFSGNMEGGIFREGRATKHANFKDTEVVEIEKIK
jgi:hypothetical protein